METDYRVFDYIFNPRAVAIIGASPSDLATIAQMKTKIRERLYLVNPKYTEVLGKKCYPSILDVDAEIDYVIIGISASLLPQVLEQCIRKGVKVAQIFTAGFSETGIPERVKQEEELKKRDRIEYLKKLGENGGLRNIDKPEMAKKFGEVDLYLGDDGAIYIS